MSIAATVKAYEASPGDSVGKLILIALADYADENGASSVKLSILAEFAGVSERDAQVALILLDQRGFITYGSVADAYIVRGVAP